MNSGTMNVKQLRALAGTLQIVGRSNMNKAELVIAIKELEVAAKAPVKTTRDYIASLEGGELVAFTPNGRNTISGKVLSISTDKTEVLVQTKSGSNHKVKSENIVWVRTGSRWPRWVFEMFGKGTTVCQEKLM